MTGRRHAVPGTIPLLIALGLLVPQSGLAAVLTPYHTQPGGEVVKTRDALGADAVDTPDGSKSVTIPGGAMEVTARAGDDAPVGVFVENVSPHVAIGSNRTTSTASVIQFFNVPAAGTLQVSISFSINQAQTFFQVTEPFPRVLGVRDLGAGVFVYGVYRFHPNDPCTPVTACPDVTEESVPPQSVVVLYPSAPAAPAMASLGGQIAASGPGVLTVEAGITADSIAIGQARAFAKGTVTATTITVTL
jgi:hypothetical protein